MNLGLLAIASLLLSAALLSAQAERITVRMAPAPNQTIRQRTTQEMVMTTDMTAAPGGAAPAPSPPMTASTIVESTSAVGPTDADGRYSAKMTVDRVSATVMMNGKPMPLPALDDSVKPVIVFSFAQDGQILDVSMANTGGAAAIDAVKQLMMRAMQSTMPLTLSVGESVTVPTALNLPVAGGAIAPAGFTAETRYTLTSVTYDDADRIAHLATHTTTTVAPGSGASTPELAPGLTMTMTSDGTSDVNIDRGFVLHSEQRMTLQGSMRTGTGTAPPAMALHGTVRIVSDLVK